MIKFVKLNTINVAKDSQLCEIKVLKAISDGNEASLAGEVTILFHFAQCQMVSWSKLHVIIAAAGKFTLPDKIPAFTWLRCEENVDDLEGFLREAKIITYGGTRFGADGKAFRASMLDTDEAFNVFIERLASLTEGEN